MNTVSPAAPTTNQALLDWVNECAALTTPDRVFWCDGSPSEYDSLIESMVDDGTLIRLNPSEYPGCFLHRSNPNDVARVEQLTFICSERQQDAGPTNHWMAPDEALATLTPLFQGCMKGRTLYVVPYLMGPEGSPQSRVGVEITDSPYVVASMRIMTRMGRVALERLGNDGTFVGGLHSVGELDPARRFICHFPETNEIWSYGSGYGGNALLGKKCHALRLASVQAKSEGWMAEHMLILELSDPSGALTYFAAAFPSACGKTNLAMLVSPLEDQGYRVRTVGDDIAWLRIGADGRLWAINPEAGFFGVVPGTSEKTNPHALASAHANTLFTNVAVTSEGIPWWEGKTKPPPGLIDWLGRPWNRGGPAAHPNSRFTAPAAQNPGQSPHWEDATGVPISGFLFGGRRATTMPLVFQARSWQHGTFVGATMASETTAAAAGQTGVVRRDPMAMLPFCGYHMGDYFAHWLAMGEELSRPPAIFHVNWFRRSEQGEYLWPGFGQNVRVLIWMLERINGRANAVETPLGLVPAPGSLPLDGLDIAPDTLAELLSVRGSEWASEVENIEAFFAGFGDRLPAALRAELDDLRARFTAPSPSP